jgi:excinuclease UvrABC helicase subunit UvrB
MHFAVRPRRRLFSVLSAAALGMSSFSAAAVTVATNVVMHPMVSDYQFISAATPTEADCEAVARTCYTPQAIQSAYNVEHDITPQSIVRAIDAVMSSVYERDYLTPAATLDGTERFHNQQQLDAYLAVKQEEMRTAAANLDFEKAAALRDEIKRLRSPELALPGTARG